MSYIVKRAKLTNGRKQFGILHDRIVIGETAYRENFTPLDANDPRKDVKIRAGVPKKAAQYNIVPASNSHELLEKDYCKPMMFQSTATAGIRHFPELYTNDTQHCPLGRFHTNVTLTISGGSSGDLIPPGEVVFLSNVGVLHRINSTTGIIEPIRWSADFGSDSRTIIWPSGSASVVGTDITNGWSGVGIQIGWQFVMAEDTIPTGPWNYTDLTDHGYLTNGTNPAYSNQIYCPIDMSIVGQTDTHIICSVAKATKTITSAPFGTLTSWTGNADFSAGAGIPIRCLMTIRKSDGYVDAVGRSQAYTASTHNKAHTSGHKVGIDPHGNLMAWKREYSASGYINFSYNNTTTNTLYYGVSQYSMSTTGTSIIAKNRWSEPTEFMDSRSNPGDAAKMYWMESVDYVHADPSYPDTHCPKIMMLKWDSDPVELAKGVAGMITPTPVQCTLSGVPPEYEGAAGDNTLRTLLHHRNYDRYEMFKIEEGGEQYVTLWMGVTRSLEAASDADTYSNSDDATSEFYRYLVVFKVDAADDTILHYVSDVGDFKYKKPMYMAVATKDNKTVVFADRNGLHPMRWNTSTESFASLDTILLEKVWGLGMDSGVDTDYATCWVEALNPLDNANQKTFHDGDSDIYQLQIGDYKDVDLKYIDADTVEHLEFSSNLLLTEKDVNGDYIAKSFEILVRVKSQTGSTEEDFDTGNSVVFKVSGGNMETDGLYITGYDSGNPYQKTITSGADWVTVTVNYKLPLTRVTMSANIV